MRRLTPLALLALLAACAEAPDLGPPTPGVADAPFVPFLPLDTLLAEAQPTPAPLTQDAQSRIAALNARAAALRGPVIDPATRARLDRAARAAR
ncbi:MAG: hypothetical protein ACU0CI_07660 [Shimia sp.]